MPSSPLRDEVMKLVTESERCAVRLGYCCAYGLLKSHGQLSNQALAKLTSFTLREIKALRLLYKEKFVPYTIECHKQSSPLPDPDLTCYAEKPHRYFQKLSRDGSQ